MVGRWDGSSSVVGALNFASVAVPKYFLVVLLYKLIPSVPASIFPLVRILKNAYPHLNFFFSLSLPLSSFREEGLCLASFACSFLP